MSKVGKSPRTPARRGRPPIHDERWSKVSVVLFERQIVELDHLATEMRRKSSKAVNRAAVIRALIDALFDSGIDLSGATSAGDLKQMLLGRSSGARNTPRPRLG